MKTLVGLAVAVALTTGVAHASITNPGNGTGEVIELVLDNSNGHVYARGTQIAFSTVLPASVIQSASSYPVGTPPIATGFTFAPILADNNLTTFLGQDGGKDSFSYALLGAGQNTTLGASAPGANIIEFTTTGSLAGGTVPDMSASQARTSVASVKVDVTTMNGIIGGTPGDGTSADVSNQFNATSSLWQLYAVSTPILAALGSNANLYAQTGNGVAANPAQVYTGGMVTMLANGTLEAAGGAPVPLPGAVWLFGSGLLGLVGIGRRRLSA